MEVALIIAVRLFCCALALIIIVLGWDLYNRMGKRNKDNDGELKLKVTDRDGNEVGTIKSHCVTYNAFKTRKQMEDARRFAEGIRKDNED